MTPVFAQTPADPNRASGTAATAGSDTTYNNTTPARTDRDHDFNFGWLGLIGLAGLLGLRHHNRTDNRTESGRDSGMVR